MKIGKIRSLEFVELTEEELKQPFMAANNHKLFAALYPDSNEKVDYVNITEEAKEYFEVAEITRTIADIAFPIFRGLEIAYHFDEEAEEYRSLFKLCDIPSFAFRLVDDHSLLRPDNNPGKVCLPLLGEMSETQFLKDLMHETEELIKEDGDQIKQSSASLIARIRKLLHDFDTFDEESD